MADERQYQGNRPAWMRVRPAEPPAPPKVLPPLTEAEHARIKSTIATIKEKAPELLPLIKGFHELGLIDGWRSVTLTKVK